MSRGSWRMRAVVKAVIRLGAGGADSGTIGDDDNAAGPRLGADPRRQRSTRHPPVETPHVALDELADHAEGLLPAERAATVTAHVATCPTCQAQQARLSAVRTVLAADDAGPMPAAVAARIETVLAAEQHSTAGPPPLGPLGRLGPHPRCCGERCRARRRRSLGPVGPARERDGHQQGQQWSRGIGHGRQRERPNVHRSRFQHASPRAPRPPAPTLGGPRGSGRTRGQRNRGTATVRSRCCFGRAVVR